MSDDEAQIDPKAHIQLLDGISRLGKTQHIRRPTHTEPTENKDEFSLYKGNGDERAKVGPIKDILNALQGTEKNLKIAKKLQHLHVKKQVLQKPLEKPVADRLKRQIGYEKTKAMLERWDAVVTKNRSAETQVFPLPTETIYVDTFAHSKPLQLSIKSDLQREMEATEAKLTALQKERRGDTQNDDELHRLEQEQLNKNLTREELIARHKELAYLKLRQSQKAAKERLRNKIKSKKYHKLLKRNKLQEQIKLFELLQKTNPEAALEKLNELERSRVLERANLRHKNTGTWAKNLKIRAKYDKDVRKDLAEQLQISRQLTQKTEAADDDDSDDNAKSTARMAVEVTDDMDNDPFNPWTRANNEAITGPTGKNIKQEEMTNWRTYWLDRNKNEKLVEEYRKADVIEDSVPVDVKVKTGTLELKPQQKPKKADGIKSKQKVDKKPKKAEGKKSKQKVDKKPVIENGWLVEELKPAPARCNLNIDAIFDKMEDKVRSKLTKKMKAITKASKKQNKMIAKKKKKQTAAPNALKNLEDLSFRNQAQRPIIDEELNPDEPVNKRVELNGDTATNAVNGDDVTAKTISPCEQQGIIDPNKVATVKLKQYLHIDYGVNEALHDSDIDEEMADDAKTTQQMTISEAFEDDDIVADFSMDKSKDSELKNTEIQLSMPGWGSWAGAGISAERANKNNRLVLKIAKEEKRRDENKGGLYINEQASKQLRTHLVSDVPFPFTCLQDFEASIRAPIGRNFVPETAFRMLTRPAVITRKGKVIEPMDENELVKPPRQKRNVVDKRIDRAAAEKEAAKGAKT